MSRHRRANPPPPPANATTRHRHLATTKQLPAVSPTRPQQRLTAATTAPNLPGPRPGAHRRTRPTNSRTLGPVHLLGIPLIGLLLLLGHDENTPAGQATTTLAIPSGSQPTTAASSPAASSFPQITSSTAAPAVLDPTTPSATVNYPASTPPTPSPTTAPVPTPSKPRDLTAPPNSTPLALRLFIGARNSAATRPIRAADSGHCAPRSTTSDSVQFSIVWPFDVTPGARRVARSRRQVHRSVAPT